jgi:predicted transcriptional regulator YdeE
MTPVLIHKPGFTMAGISTRTSNDLETNQETARIPVLWGRIFKENIFEKIPSKVSPGGLVAVYTDYEGDHTTPYTLVVGAVIQNQSDAVIPTGMVTQNVPAQDYLQFPVRGKMPDALIQAWRDIWSYFDGTKPHLRTYQADFEEHNVDGSEAEIYIGVKPRQ